MEALFGGAELAWSNGPASERATAPREEPFWLLQDVQTLMERAALEQPLLVCLDDLQSASAGCGFALRMLTQWLASLPVAWLIAVRPDQGVPQIRRALAELITAGAATIRLTPLNAQAVAEVAADVLGAHRREVTSSGPWPTCKATPSSLLIFSPACARRTWSRWQMAGRNLVENRVPHRLEGSMRRRLSRTTPAGERVVTVAASLARQFTLNQIAVMARIS